MRKFSFFALTLLSLTPVACFFLKRASRQQDWHRQINVSTRIQVSRRRSLHHDRPLKINNRKKKTKQRHQFKFDYWPSSPLHHSFDDDQKLLYQTIDEIEWNESFDALRQLYNDHGYGVQLPAALQEWSETQRQLLLLSMQKQRGGLDDHDPNSESLAFLSLKQIAKLSKLGGPWEEYSQSLRWEDWYRFMVKYYLHHGNVHVVGQECLAQWVQLQRTLVSLGLLYSYQVQLMWAVNFCWDTSEANFMIQYQRLLQLETEDSKTVNMITPKSMTKNITNHGIENTKVLSVRNWKKLQQSKNKQHQIFFP